MPSTTRTTISFGGLSKLPPAGGEGADVASPMGDPQWVIRAKFGTVTRALGPPARRGVNH